MSHRILYDAVEAPRACNDNYHPALCTEVYTPGSGWTIFVNTGDSYNQRFTFEEFFQLIYTIENGKRNKIYLDQAKDMRVSLRRMYDFQMARS